MRETKKLKCPGCKDYSFTTKEKGDYIRCPKCSSIIPIDDTSIVVDEDKSEGNKIK